VTPLGPDAPWATQEVVVRKGKKVVSVRIEPVHATKPAPWPSPPPLHPDDARYASHWITAPREKEEAHPEPAAKTGGWVPELKGVRQIGAQNYVAVEAGKREYGVIDMGQAQLGLHSLVVHVPKGRTAWPVLNRIRPGTVLDVKRAGGQRGGLRVRSTTPARYYSPGAKVSTLAVTVDSADWRSLMADARRI
jgi:hypothetical protein